MLYFSRSKQSIFLIPFWFTLAGCVQTPIRSDPYLASAPVDSLILNHQEQQALETETNVVNIGDEAARDRFISLKMYLIDRAYFDYERRLTNEDVTINSLGSIGTLASTTVAAAIPAGQATKVLAAVATGLNGATSIYDDKVLLTKTIQALQIQMRTDRDLVAARIYARRKCSLIDYNVGLALSDLEAYARAGTFEAGLQGLTQTVSKAHDSAADLKNASRSGTGTRSNLADEATATAVLAEATPQCSSLTSRDPPR